MIVINSVVEQLLTFILVITLKRTFTSLMKRNRNCSIQSFCGLNNQRKADVTYRKTNPTPQRCSKLESLRAIARDGVKFYLEILWFVKNCFLGFLSALQNNPDVYCFPTYYIRIDLFFN